MKRDTEPMKSNRTRKGAPRDSTRTHRAKSATVTRRQERRAKRAVRGL